MRLHRSHRAGYFPTLQRLLSLAAILFLDVHLFAAAQSAQHHPKAVAKKVRRAASRRSAAVASEHKKLALDASTTARPAAVTLEDGKLTIDANNSDLRHILQDLSRQSGMIVEGNIKDARVYGRYGPESPSAVLSELLTGMGYNIIMVGSAREGAPRELMLSSRLDLPVSPVAPSPEPTTAEEPVLGPGAIAHPPPQEEDDPQMRVYRHDQKLQRMYDTLEKANGSR